MKKSTVINKTKSKSVKKSTLETQPIEITKLLARDHQPLKKLIETLKSAKAPLANKSTAYDEFKRTLTAHAKAEEESLYTQLEEMENLRVDALEGLTEHKLAEQLMAEVDLCHDNVDLWLAKVKVLAELVDHHIKEEEEVVFKKVKKNFSISRLVEIGELYTKLLNRSLRKVDAA